MKNGSKIETTGSFVTRKGDLVVKSVKKHWRFGDKYKSKDTFNNEVSVLRLLKGNKGIQSLVRSNYPNMVTRYGGSHLKKRYVSESEAKKQCEKIVDVLDSYGVYHRDIRPENLVCRDGVIRLIDFQWAYYKGCFFSSLSDCPDCLGGSYRDGDKFSNKISMIKTLKEIYK